MQKSIFDYEIRIELDKEFKNLHDMLYLTRSIYYDGWISLYTMINDVLFPKWRYKGIFIDFENFLDRMEIDLDNYNSAEIDFLSVLEVLINLWDDMCDYVCEENINPKIIGYFEHTIPVVVEKMNYEMYKDVDKIRLIKRNADVDSIMECTPKIANLLLDYNDIRNNAIDSKKKILKGIDLYIEENKKAYKNINNQTYESIQQIVNELGVNHPIKEKYKDMPEVEISKWYDRCFKLMIHLIRQKEVNEINVERKNLVGD